ncbi:Putative LOC100197221, partial [Caligus rogercresseyi]
MSEFGSTRFMKTWTVDPVRNRRNDRYLTRDVDENAYRGRLHRDSEDQVHPLGLENFPVGMWCSSRMERPPYGEGHAGVPGVAYGLLGKDLWPPQSSDANPLNYAFWPHIESKACKLRHPNIDALKAAVNQEWAGMYEGFVS